MTSPKAKCIVSSDTDHFNVYPWQPYLDHWHATLLALQLVILMCRVPSRPKYWESRIKLQVPRALKVMILSIHSHLEYISQPRSRGRNVPIPDTKHVRTDAMHIVQAAVEHFVSYGRFELQRHWRMHSTANCTILLGLDRGTKQAMATIA